MKKVFKKIQNEQFEVLLKKLTEIKEGTQRTKVGIINFATSQLRNDYFNPKVNLLVFLLVFGLIMVILGEGMIFLKVTIPMNNKL